VQVFGLTSKGDVFVENVTGVPNNSLEEGVCCEMGQGAGLSFCRGDYWLADARATAL